MIQEEIIEGNKLIAEFMGIKHMTSKGWEHCYVGAIKPEDLTFQNDWNLLMPVVEKIVKKYDLTIQFMDGDCNIFLSKQTVNQDEIFSIGGYDEAKEGVWDAVVKFIKWFNKTNQRF